MPEAWEGFDPKLLILARRAAAFTQHDLAARCFRSVFTIRAYEQGRKRPSSGALVLLANALGVDPNDLISKNDARDAHEPLRADHPGYGSAHRATQHTAVWLLV